MDFQVILTDHQTFGAVVEGMERISNLISRYAIFEDLYLNPELKSYDGLERALIELYLRIFKYLSKAIKFYKKGTASISQLNIDVMQLVNRITVARLVDTIKNSAEKFEPLLLNIIQQESEVERFAKLADAESIFPRRSTWSSNLTKFSFQVKKPWPKSWAPLLRVRFPAEIRHGA